MRRLITFLTAMVCVAVLFCACGSRDGDGDVTSSAITTSQESPDTKQTEVVSITTTEKNTKEEAVDNMLHIVEKGETKYRVVLPSGSMTKPGGNGVSVNEATGKIAALPKTVDTALVTRTRSLLEGLSALTGVSLEVTDDASTEAGEWEVLIGATNRPESETVRATLSKNTFAIKVMNGKLVVVGFDDNMTVEALCFISEHYTEAVPVTSEGMTIPDSFSYVSKPLTQTPANTLKAGKKYTLKKATELLSIGADGQYKVMQGGATDGTYLYYCMENQSLEAHESYIYKVDPATGKVITRSKSLQLDHSNDMTYNAKLRQLLVVHNAPNRKYVSFIDIDTLEKVKTIKLDWEIFCMAYNEEADEYCIGLSGGQSFAVIDSEFRFIRRYNIGDGTGYTTQGMTADGNYVYFAQSGANVIVVYDWDGYLVDIVPIEFTNDETENICFIGNNVYIGFYLGAKGGRVYKTSFSER